MFGTSLAEIPANESGEIYYPKIARGVRMRDGTGRKVEGSQHSDPRAELVRWSICEGGLIQAIGRGRGVNRKKENSLKIDIVTNVCLPIEVDEILIWEKPTGARKIQGLSIQPSLARIMWARGAVPTSYRDMAQAYPDLFPSREAAKKAIERENWGQTLIENLLIGLCPQFLSITYRRSGSRGPAARLLYDPQQIDPVRWLTEQIGAGSASAVTILTEIEAALTETAIEPATTANFVEIMRMPEIR
jgi:putative DNA primase/helicase